MLYIQTVPLVLDTAEFIPSVLTTINKQTKKNKAHSVINGPTEDRVQHHTLQLHPH